MDKVKQADLQYQDAIDEIAYYREELKKRDSRIHELEQALKGIKELSDAERGGDIYIKMQKVNKRAAAALK